MVPLDPVDTAPVPTITPMMGQFLEIKAANPGFLLFYRMGDFYEMFFEDAEIASAALGIVLTKRGKHQGQDIPMCGVPIHAAQDYLKKLISLGHRVAICEQVEDPAEARKRGGKSPVKRDVVRLVTAGTLTEDDLLPQRGARHLAALAMLKQGEADWALAYADVSTGEVTVVDIPAEAVADELARIDPAELLLTADARLAISAGLPSGAAVVELTADAFDSLAAASRIVAVFPDGAVDPTAFSRAGRAAMGALLHYIGEAQKAVPLALRLPGTDAIDRHMAIDAATRQSLELLETARGERRGSLLHDIDSTVTAAGARLLHRRLAAPLCKAPEINGRLEAVAALERDLRLRTTLRQTLKSVPDLMRALTRLSLDRGGPRDLRAIAQALAPAAELTEALTRIEALPADLAALVTALADAPAELADQLLAALDDDLPLLARDGGFVRRGADAALDRERELASETRTVVAALQARLVTETDLKALKIRHNGVLGYFVEVPAGVGSRLLEEPHRQSFIHRQTMANAMRFTTAELAELEGRIARAHDAALEIELAIFARLRTAVLDVTERLHRLADALAELDVTAALAHLAANRQWCRPVVDASLAFSIEAGRHPVVESSLSAGHQVFVANDTELSEGALWLITGPNMGGKSTFLRQNALIAILAQIGSFVPAAAAHIGVVDRVFSRVGASDDIARGRSTFMVEMVETAAILNRATRRSLVILDEIGRGTATFDGLAIAWAAVESLHNDTGCRALFATHFHEMTALSKTLKRVRNVTMSVREWEGEVVFLHEVIPGAADRSYGIQVARLAGLPRHVVARARQVLSQLERRSSGGSPPMLDELPLFAAAPPPQQPEINLIHDILDQVRPDELSPREALDVVYALKKARDVSRN